ncbi:unnamed protein product [Phytophthora fragariaefolia]|uniref:Unnamed protein product n=1 Tax=Phytophthora fragariaefolia TaxID=1490495 RepID=A0A9W6TYZ7_9STRA|nr:unnamed protein product [Phytophthora fragariaefolia]
MIGNIYRIQHIKSNLAYVGSTMNEIKYRWQQHKCLYKAWRDGKKESAGCALLKYFDEFAIDEFKCFLVKSYEVIDLAHLEAYETLWIKKLKGCNQNLPFAIKKLNDKALYAKNRDSRIKKVRAYAETNKDLIAQRTKQYRQKNKDAIKAKKSESFLCDCGGRWSKGHGKPRHD